MRISLPLFAALLLLATPLTAAANDSGIRTIPDESLPPVGIPAHDPDCILPFAAIPSGILMVPGEIPTSLMDDLHLATTANAALCAFTFTARNFDGLPHTLTINFREGGATDPVPGAVTAGPFVVTINPGTASYHVEAGAGYVTPNTYFEVRWDNFDLIGIRNADGTTAGSSHPTYYYDPPGGFYGSDVDKGNVFVQVFVSPPVPTESSTWGAVKAIYR